MSRILITFIAVVRNRYLSIISIFQIYLKIVRLFPDSITEEHPVLNTKLPLLEIYLFFEEKD